MNRTIQKEIKEMIEKDDVVLFMKGSESMPRCGFSGKTVQLLKEVLDGTAIKLKTYDVLLDQDLREGIKIFSEWPTIPQLYIRGEFVGGCDIVTDLYNSGDLKKLIESKQ
jgi:monothiol glutaredoxin